MAEVYTQINRLDRSTQLLRVCLQRFPRHAVAWYEFAAASAQHGNCYDCVTALSRALALDSSSGRLRDLARKDPRLQRCRDDPQFQKTLGAL